MILPAPPYVVDEIIYHDREVGDRIAGDLETGVDRSEPVADPYLGTEQTRFSVPGRAAEGATRAAGLTACTQF